MQVADAIVGQNEPDLGVGGWLLLTWDALPPARTIPSGWH